MIYEKLPFEIGWKFAADVARACYYVCPHIVQQLKSASMEKSLARQSSTPSAKFRRRNGEQEAFAPDIKDP